MSSIHKVWELESGWTGDHPDRDWDVQDNCLHAIVYEQDLNHWTLGRVTRYSTSLLCPTLQEEIDFRQSSVLG